MLYSKDSTDGFRLMLNVLKVRIDPNKEQELALAKNFGCVRFVWNYYLNKTNNQYLETGKGMTYCDMEKTLPNSRNNWILNG